MCVCVSPLIVAAEKLVTKAEYDFLRCSQAKPEKVKIQTRLEAKTSSVCVFGDIKSTLYIKEGPRRLALSCGCAKGG